MKLCVALDLPSYEENMALARELKDFDIWLKVGFRSYIRDGKKILERIEELIVLPNSLKKQKIKLPLKHGGAE